MFPLGIALGASDDLEGDDGALAWLKRAADHGDLRATVQLAKVTDNAAGEQRRPRMKNNGVKIREEWGEWERDSQPAPLISLASQ